MKFVFKFVRIRQFFFNNTSTRQTIAKNTFWLISGQIFSRFIRAAIIIYAARILGAQEWGIFSYVLSLAGFFTIFADFGINAVITRESSRDIEKQKKYFSTSLFIKLVMIVVLAFVVILIAPIFIKQRSIELLLPLAVFIIGFDVLRDFAASLSRAWEKMEIEAFVQVITNTAIFIAGFVAIYFYPNAQSLLLAYVVGIGIGMVVAFYQFKHYLKNLKDNFSKYLIKPIIYSSWPLGMLGLMGAIMLNTDSIMLGWYKNMQDVGYYSAGQRIAQLIYLIPGLIATAFFPSFARLINEKEKFKKMLNKSLQIIGLIALPLMTGGFFLSSFIIKLLYGTEYLQGVFSFKLMNLTYLPVFLSAILGNALFALNKEKSLFTYVILGVSGNFLFNLLLIPTFGIAGAALSTLINQIIITIYLIFKLRKEIDFKIF
ncbi:hypothetical protein COV23_00120 [Candidatus Wolfebacteria bacterium CG10_big_fil_rev_8_21_14_0_10_31_9]|uniref:Uncharacterized protein n=1 Tax=Candidatus Wolfebacteria bacterium CG10_big_fil_rev_8_21_14_0_10_31_9 TaxID=1975070 RepID=A0A2H0RDD6_9BACT|nr:MAG: hypothetical protein COV23_00120 [Candidatus Wolfebacteria bacterium CG10_big_fil_rev_8_21_14_0_10_31_9]